MFKKLTNFMKSNKMYAAYNFDNPQMKIEVRNTFFQMSPEERFNMVNLAHNALMQKGKVWAALNLMSDYKEELIKPEYDIYRGGTYEDFLSYK